MRIFGSAISGFLICCAAGSLALPASAYAQTATASQPPPPAAGAPRADDGSSLVPPARVKVRSNAPIQFLDIPVEVDAAQPISYSGSAYRDDLSGQSESSSDPAIADGARGVGAEGIDAW